MAEHLRSFASEEGVLFVGKAQEKTPVFRTEKRKTRRRDSHTPGSSRRRPWSTTSTSTPSTGTSARSSSSSAPTFPYNAKLCLNGHEYVKRQLAKEGIAFEALDNGILSCADPERLQQICDGLSAAQDRRPAAQVAGRLPHPFTADDRQAGYRYDVSILQAEFSLTQVLDRPRTAVSSSRR